MLEVDSVQLSFKNRKILSDVFISAEKGKITGLLGRNGEGKSSLLKIIYGTLSAPKFVRINGKTVTAAYRHPELIRCLPQFNFIPVKENLKTIFDLFENDFGEFTTHFPEFHHNYLSRINALSGGGRRIVEIYTLLKSKTEFVLLDEPFSHISPVQIDKIKTILLREAPEKGFIITDHLYNHVVEMSSSLYILSNKKTYLTHSVKDLETLGYTINSRSD